MSIRTKNNPKDTLYVSLTKPGYKARSLVVTGMEADTVLNTVQKVCADIELQPDCDGGHVRVMVRERLYGKTLGKAKSIRLTGRRFIDDEEKIGVPLDPDFIYLYLLRYWPVKN